MLEQIGIAVLTGLVIGPISAAITVQLALNKFKDERRWEKRFLAYERLLNALHTIKQNNIHWENALRVDKATPPTEKLEELDVKREEAIEFLDQAIDLGEVLLPSNVISEIRTMLNDIRSLEYTEENYNECYERENTIVDKALASLRKKCI